MRIPRWTVEAFGFGSSWGPTFLLVCLLASFTQFSKVHGKETGLPVPAICTVCTVTLSHSSSCVGSGKKRWALAGGKWQHEGVGFALKCMLHDQHCPAHVCEVYQGHPTSSVDWKALMLNGCKSTFFFWV